MTSHHSPLKEFTMGQLDGKFALISGAARGQGATEAKLFAAEGARVMLTDVLEELGRRTAADLGAAAAFAPLDTRSEAAWEAAVSATLERFGRLDILVNNAGIITPMGSTEKTTLDEYMQVTMVNQIGVFLGMKVALRGLRVQGGSIINISSVAGLHACAGGVAYGATKWAVRGMTKTAAIEFAPYGIRVNSVHPGWVDTEMAAPIVNPAIDKISAGVPLGRIARPEEVAKMVLFLASEASSYCTGSEFIIDGGRMAL